MKSLCSSHLSTFRDDDLLNVGSSSGQNPCPVLRLGAQTRLSSNKRTTYTSQCAFQLALVYQQFQRAARTGDLRLYIVRSRCDGGASLLRSVIRRYLKRPRQCFHRGPRSMRCHWRKCSATSMLAHPTAMPHQWQPRKGPTSTLYLLDTHYTSM